MDERKIEEAKEVIKQEIMDYGFNEDGDILINFSDVCTEDETRVAAEEMNYDSEPAEGQGSWWISKRF